MILEDIRRSRVRGGGAGCNETKLQDLKHEIFEEETHALVRESEQQFGIENAQIPI